MARHVLAALVGILTLAAVAPAFAQDADAAPYSPREYPRSELIDLGTTTDPPVHFIWQPTEVRLVPQQSRLDFELVFDEDTHTIISHFEQGYKDRSAVAQLTEEALPFITDRDLFVMGSSTSDGHRVFTLAAGPDMRRFLVDVLDRGAKTHIVVRNGGLAMLFSGITPPRIAFQPIGAEAIPFKWD